MTKTMTAGHARFVYRLRVPASARRELEAEWARCRWVWNECVARSQGTHAHNLDNPQDKRTCGPAELDRMLTRARSITPWLREGSCVPQQQIIRDFGRARAKAIKDITAKLPAHQRTGMPRLKARKGKRASRPSLNYTRRGFRLTGQGDSTMTGGRLWLAGGIQVGVVWSRPLPAGPSSVRVFQDRLGHWYASFVVPAALDPLPATGQVIGIDWGVKALAITTSDAHDLEHPQHGAKAAARLAAAQRMMARRRPEKGRLPSRGYREAQRMAAKAYRKVARQRQDTARKWAKKVVRAHDVLAVEDFRPQFLAKSPMARKAADAAIGAAKQAVVDMGRKHGRDVHLIPPAHTTTDCAACGARAKSRLPLSARTYRCDVCGISVPRDKNSAFVMLRRAGLTPAGVDRVRLGRPQDERAA
ncbi:transposase [Streptomyces sp. YC504]|uniref:Transposase n=1 Tax=Streptomyces mesophilus TaxID=1775132 RepID=A0A6G4XEQ6_9ACTN|nr:RNA-guided endonuclease TnpB family protein [Streptomyces mesophilus]NGO75131.1 transposase [Streptomyces mesophilus]